MTWKCWALLDRYEMSNKVKGAKIYDFKCG